MALPPYIERIAKHVRRAHGHPEAAAQGIALATVQRWVAEGVASARAELALREAKHDPATRKTLRQYKDLLLAPNELDGLVEALAGRKNLVEGVLMGFGAENQGAAVANAKSLLEARSGRVTLTLGQLSASEDEVVEAVTKLTHEVSELDDLMTGAMQEAARRGVKVKAPAKAPAPPAHSGDLKHGDQGERVKHLQNRLSSLGHDAQPDGNFGPMTHAAVREFQRHANVKEDGVVGPRTTHALRTAPDPETMAAASEEETAVADAAVPGGTPEPPTPHVGSKTTVAPDGAGAVEPSGEPVGKADKTETLYKGKGVGEARAHAGVKAAQGTLAKVGYPVSEDGRFGPETEHAVKKFQRRYGLKADGIVAEKTHRTLKGVEKNLAALREAVEQRKAAVERGDTAGFRAARVRELRLRESLGDVTVEAPLEEAATEPSPLDELDEAFLEECRAVGAAELAEFDYQILTEAMDLQEAKDSMKKASTPEPFSTSKTSNWVARSGGLPAYIQHIAHDLMEKRGKSESNAIQMAIGIVKNWASGKGNVDESTRAAAAKAVKEWFALRAKNAGRKAGAAMASA